MTCWLSSLIPDSICRTTRNNPPTTATMRATSATATPTPHGKHIGYENAAKITNHAIAEGLTIREAVLALGFVDRGELTMEQLTVEQLDKGLDVMTMTRAPQ